MEKNASDGQFTYDFEQPVAELDEQISLLEKELHEGAGNAEELESRLGELCSRRDEMLAGIMQNLTPYQRVRLARHPDRPQSRDYIRGAFEEFIELHGDRRFGDDRAIVTGLASLEGRRVMIIAQQKGRETREKLETNFGMPQPEGYRKALVKMGLAEKFGIPVISLIDTPGAAPAVEAEERGQGMAIAENIYRMAGLRTPIITVITGEGCSGGALGIGVGDRHGMLENAYYSVITPEGCAAILFHDASKADEAARALRITAGDMKEFGIIDDIVPEPPGGAHRDPKAAVENVKKFLITALDELSGVPVEHLLSERYERYRCLGECGRAAEEVQEAESSDS